eukprot:m.291935 g.291935  ORF g.291935 m.291935 type:complete len:280 (+) comp19480_c4_seq1:576-1415(+)
MAVDGDAEKKRKRKRKRVSAVAPPLETPTRLGGAVSPVVGSNNNSSDDESGDEATRSAVPVGFEALRGPPNEHALCLEDVMGKKGDGKQLWLVRLPASTDVAGLDGLTLDLSNPVSSAARHVVAVGDARYRVVVSGGHGGGRAAGAYGEYASLCPVLPRRSDGRLAPGPALRGQCTLALQVGVPPVPGPPSDLATPAVKLDTEAFRHVFSPFGLSAEAIAATTAVVPESPQPAPASAAATKKDKKKDKKRDKLPKDKKKKKKKRPRDDDGDDDGAENGH